MLARTLTGAALLLAAPSFATSTSLVAPEEGAVVGSVGAASVTFEVAPDPAFVGQWGMRVIASRELANVTNPGGFGYLDYYALRYELDYIRSDFAGRGLFFSSLRERAEADAKRSFFSGGYLADLRSGTPSSSTVVRLVIPTGSSSATAFLNGPGTWYWTAASATEAQVVWSSEVGTLQVPAPEPVSRPSPPSPTSSRQPAAPSPPVGAPPPTTATVTVSPPVSTVPAGDPRCLGWNTTLTRMPSQISAAKRKITSAKTKRAKIRARASLNRLLVKRGNVTFLARTRC